MTTDNAAPQDPGRRPPRKLQIDLDDLAFALENAGPEASYFFDLETARIILITADIRGEYNELVEGLGDVDPAQWAAAFEAALREWDGPDWEREVLVEADLVEAGFGVRYIRLPDTDSREGYGDMEDYIETVADQRPVERLHRTIQGRGAFRRFKDVVLNDPGERERWFAFQNARQRALALEWLAEENIEPL